MAHIVLLDDGWLESIDLCASWLATRDTSVSEGHTSLEVLTLCLGEVEGGSLLLGETSHGLSHVLGASDDLCRLLLRLVNDWSGALVGLGLILELLSLVGSQHLLCLSLVLGTSGNSTVHGLSIKLSVSVEVEVEILLLGESHHGLELVGWASDDFRSIIGLCWRRSSLLVNNRGRALVGLGLLLELLSLVVGEHLFGLSLSGGPSGSILRWIILLANDGRSLLVGLGLLLELLTLIGGEHVFGLSLIGGNSFDRLSKSVELDSHSVGAEGSDGADESEGSHLG